MQWDQHCIVLCYCTCMGKNFEGVGLFHRFCKLYLYQMFTKIYNVKFSIDPSACVFRHYARADSYQGVVVRMHNYT